MKMQVRRWLSLVPVTLALLMALDAMGATEKTEELYFSGRVIELDAAKHTFTIRSKKKELVFTIEPRRCNITVDGSVAEQTLKWARIGDAVLGELSLKEAKPYVSWVEFTHKPQVGKPVSKQPGFILSPYLPKWPEPWHHAEPMDARQLARGDMVLDDVTGKIFLVP
jgi:hypothetical protein